MNEKSNPPAYFAARMASGYGWFFLATGIYLPFFPIWLKSLGLNPDEIGIILAIPIFVRVLTSSQISSYADTKPDRAVVFTQLGWLCFFSACLFLWTQNFWALAAIAFLHGIFQSAQVPILDALTLSGVRRFAADYGKIRLWGSLTFILANMVGGALLGIYSEQFIIWVIVAISLLAAISAHLLPRIGRANPGQDKNQGKFGFKAASNLPHFLPFLLAAGLLQASHAMIYGFGSILWQGLGFSGTVIGILWAIGVFAEVCLFQVATRIFRLISPTALLAIGAVGAILRWIIQAMEPGLTVTVFLQVLHGLSFGATHIATMYFIMQSVPENRIASAQGLGTVIASATMAIATFTAGFIFEEFGAKSFLISALLALAALIITLKGWKSRIPVSTP